MSDVTSSNGSGPKKQIRLIDSTLRDGSHAVSHQFTSEQVRKIAAALDACGIGTMEISHGDGLGGASFNYGFSGEPETNWLKAARDVVQHANLAILLLPGIGTREHMVEAHELGVKVARIATHCTEADIAEQHIGLAKELGMEAIGFLMLSHMISPMELSKQAKLMDSYGVDVVYVTDSAGAMTPNQYREKVRALKETVACEVGVHCHGNLGMAIANSLAAVEEGATVVDGCLGGLGAGAGNAQLEVLTAVFDIEGYDTGVDLFKVIDACENTVRPIMRRPQVIDGPSLILGYAGVYSSFLLHTDRAAKRFNVDPRDVLIELGKRKVVGGQEDMIIEVAAMLSKQRQLTPA